MAKAMKQAAGPLPWDEAEERDATEFPPDAETNPGTVKREFVEFTRRRRRFRQRHTDAISAVRWAETNLERQEARARLRIRMDLKPSGASLVDGSGRKVTQEDLEALVATSDEVRGATDQLVQAQVEKDRLAGVMDDISAKKEMLISLGAHWRTELEGDPTIRKRT